MIYLDVTDWVWLVRPDIQSGWLGVKKQWFILMWQIGCGWFDPTYRQVDWALKKKRRIYLDVTDWVWLVRPDIPSGWLGVKKKEKKDLPWCDRLGMAGSPDIPSGWLGVKKKKGSILMWQIGCGWFDPTYRQVDWALKKKWLSWCDRLGVAGSPRHTVRLTGRLKKKEKKKKGSILMWQIGCGWFAPTYGQVDWALKKKKKRIYLDVTDWVWLGRPDIPSGWLGVKKKGSILMWQIGCGWFAPTYRQVDWALKKLWLSWCDRLGVVGSPRHTVRLTGR